MSDGNQRQNRRRPVGYWRTNLRILAFLLSVWFVCSCLLSIVFVEQLNNIQVGGFPLGFWFAQQGAIYVFIVLTFVYAFLMERLDRRHGVKENR